MYHTPVLLEETIDYLALTNGGRVIDATLGDGGHSAAMLQIIGPAGRLLGIDASPISLERATERLAPFRKQISLVHGNFADLQTLAKGVGITSVDAILMDLGLASWQLDESHLGLSFQQDEPLDMRLNPDITLTAADILNQWSPPQLEEIFEGYGDLPRARPLVKQIVAARHLKPIRTTFELVAIVGNKSPRVLAPIFQALRIAVNDEAIVLKRAISAAIETIQPTGRLVVISYHSGEDRIVKTLFREAAISGRGTILTPKPVTPSQTEARQNPRSRSAKLRALSAERR